VLTIPEREWLALRKLAESSVRFLLIGGHAVRHYAGERATDDVDLFVDRTPSNAYRLWAAIVNILGRVPEFDWQVLAEPKKHIDFAQEEPSLGILTTLPDLEFESAFGNRAMVSQDGLEVPVIGKLDLIAVKKRIAERDPQRREGELRDVELLESSAG
jgi:predicted nucleotidyltransferase